jgi:CheY-like chemotaxis protein
MAYGPKRILIVEDNKLDVKLLKDILETRGYETLQTGDGLEAIHLAFAYPPDLILMGYPIARHIRAGSDPPTQR